MKQQIEKRAAEVLAFSNRDPEAQAIGDLYRRARSSMADSVKYSVEAGHRLKAKKDSLAHGEWLPWLADNADVLGFETRMTSSRLMKLAEKCNVNVTFDETEALRLNRIAWGNNVRGTEGTGEFERYTPARYIELVREVLGEIDLDPATCEEAQDTVQASDFFVEEENGLEREWKGRVFLNPPYHRELAPKFINKLVAEYAAGRVSAAIVLTNNSTDTDWFDVAIRASAGVCFTHGRIRFIVPDDDNALPTQGQTFFYLGDDVQQFEDVFCVIGFCVKPSRQYESCDVPRDNPEER